MILFVNVLFILYLLMILFFLIGWFSNNYKESKKKNRLSVVIAVRNEQDNIGFLIDYPTYPTQFTVKEYISLLNYIYKNDTKLQKSYQENLITFFELDKYQNLQISELSTGFVKRVKLLATMLHNPNLFIWDEPFSGIDKNFIPKLVNKIKALSLEENKFFLITTHISEIKSFDFVLNNFGLK